MISLHEAQVLVREHAAPLPPAHVAIAQSLGLVLSEAVTSRVDSPPYDKAVMDGYAVVAQDLCRGRRALTVIEEVSAGALPQQTVRPGTATRIMTGAPIPEGADAVVKVEWTEPVGSDAVRIDQCPVEVGQNIMRLGTSLRQGDVVLAHGAVIRPIEVGLLADVGQTQVAVIPRPHVAVLATGNELVRHCQVPASGRIRNSNGPMLAAAVARAEATPVELGIARDDPRQLAELAGRGLEVADVLVLSGGVSAGVKDLVPHVLTRLAVREVFHKVRLKPGKPIWFGVRRQQARSKLVFGLPGNPVSSLIGFELLVRPAIAALAGRGFGQLLAKTVPLAATHHYRDDRPTYHPARLVKNDARYRAELLAWHGSADLASLAAADCLIHFPAGERTYAAGEPVEVLLLWPT